MKSIKLATVILTCLLYWQLSFAQTHIYKHFGVDEGLPSSEVYDIYQDKEGYMWFATDRGLSRYNGYEFENFTTKNGLPDNTILDFHPQKNGQIWCYGFHSHELFYFDETFNGFKSYKYNHLLKELLNNTSIVKSIVLDEAGDLFVGGYNLPGYIKITSQGELTRKYSITSEELGAKSRLCYQPQNGLFYLIYHDYEPNDDLSIFNREHPLGSRMDVKPLNNKDLLIIDHKLGVISEGKKVRYIETKQNPTGIRPINDTTFFVGYYSDGAEIRNINGKVITSFLKEKSVSNFLIDKEGSYWFSTLDDGVFFIKNPNIKLFTQKHISSVVKNDKNILYTGFNDGSIAKINNNTIEMLYKGFNNDDALVEFDKTTKHLYAYSDVKLRKLATTITYRIVAGKLPETNFNTILGNASNYLFTLENNKVKKNQSSYRIQDACLYNNQIFVGTSAGLCILKNDSLIQYQPNHFLKSRIDDIDIEPIKNRLYMATQGNGVVVYDNDSTYTITKENRLTNNIISEIHIENDSTIWACSNTGLNKISFSSNDTFNVQTLTKEDGLISNDVDDVEIINDTIWVATKKGLCYFNKAVFGEKSVSKVLSLNLRKVTANKSAIKENSKLNYDQNSIDFYLQAISHKNADKIKYLYRIKELDTTWIATKNRTISFSSLSPGNYTFQAKASVFDNTISKDFISYSFQILPPFWKSWWFYSLCVLLVSGIVYLFFKVRVLTYNQDVFRELIRLAIKRLKRKEQFYNFRSNGEDFKIPTHEIQYINSQGNYLDIITSKKSYTIRCKIGDFINTTPDSLEYLRVHRSYVVRIDQITSKGKNWVVINDKKIPVGETYLAELAKVQF